MALGESSKLAIHSKVVQSFWQVVKINFCVLVQPTKSQSPITIMRVHIALINVHSQNLPREHAAMVGLIKILRVLNPSQPNFQTLYYLFRHRWESWELYLFGPRTVCSESYLLSWDDKNSWYGNNLNGIDWMQFQLPYWLHLLNPSITSLGFII